METEVRGKGKTAGRAASRRSIAARLREYRLRREYAALFAVMAAIVALGVVAVLMQGGVAATREELVLDCPYEGAGAHTHGEGCYDADGALVCPLEERELHSHDDSCYEETLICGLEETEGHVHDASCYDADGELVCGLDEVEGHKHDESCYERVLVCGKDEVTEEHVHGTGCFRTVTVDDGEPAEGNGEGDTTADSDGGSYVGLSTAADGTGDAADAGDPADDDADAGDQAADGEDDAADADGGDTASGEGGEQSFYHEFKKKDGTLVLRVDVEAPEGALPDGSRMRAEWVKPNELDREMVQEAVDSKAAADDGVEPGRVLELQAVRVSFADADGVEVRPGEDVTVTLTSGLAASQDQPLVIHMEDEAEAAERAGAAGEAEPRGEVVETLTDEELARRGEGTGGQQLGDDQLAFDAAPSTYVLARTSLKHEMVSTDGKTVTVTVDAPAEAGIPQDAVVRVEEVDPDGDDYEGYEARAAEAIGAEDRDVAKARFFDIRLEGADGSEVHPQAAVDVRVELADAPGGEAEASVVHFPGDGSGAPEVVDSSEDGGTTAFKAEGFSVWGVVYTVDFHWEVDGKTYQFGIPGGGFASLSGLVEALGVVEDDASTEADEVDEFVADVASVEFSSPELVWVGKVEEGGTVGGLKEANGLDCQYSSELTEEQVAEIDAQAIEAGDWALISMRPFTSEETLTVTMKDGEVFTIRVTDGQLHTYAISDSGDTYEVIVTYDDTAEIPEDAELVVKEIPSDSSKFAENIDLVNEELKAKDESEVVNPVQFDISIVSGGVEVEPKEGSTVKVEIKLAKSLFGEDATDEDGSSSQAEGKEFEGSNKEAGLFLYNGQVITAENDELKECRIAHIAKDGSAEIIDGVENSSADDKFVMEFETESFSDYLFDGNSGNGLNNLPSTIYVGDEIYMWNQADYWVTEINNIVTETKHNNQGSSDNFKTVTAIRPGTFRIVHRNNWNNGNPYQNYKEIRVLPARTGTDTPDTIPTINNADIGLTLNLFDYDLDNYLDDYFNGSSHYDNTCIADFAGHGINSGNALKFWGSGIGNNYGALNQYVEHGVTSIVNTTLTSGYPTLSNSAGGTGNRNLSYLFEPSDGTDKKAYTNVNGLFKKVGDYYVYDSNENYAYYDTSQGNGGSFAVYEGTYEQKSRNDGGEQASSTNGKAIGFFPFHPWDEDYDLYVNWNKNLNHHFGMSMSVPFSLPKDPKAVTDTNGDPIIFEFSGDDDMWVFIDGKLAMDIGGIHQPTSGTINFQTGVVTVNNQTQMNNSTFTSRFSNLYDGQKHTLQVFYIERGGCDSNCKIQFNLTQYGDIHFDKVDKDNQSDKLAGAVFGIYKDEDCTIPLMENLKNGTSRAYVAESDAQGHVQFSDIPIGTYYLKELHAPEGYPLDNTVHTVRVYLDQTGEVKVKVTVDGVDVEAGVNILNGKPAPIDLALRKVWQNAEGESIVAPDGAHATFEIKRIRNYETYTEQTIQGQGREVSHLTVGWIHNGEVHIHEEYDLIAGTQATVSWGYKDGYEGTIGYVLNGTEYTKQAVSPHVYSQAITMPAAGGSATFYVIDNSDDGEAITNINVAGSQFYGNSGGGVIHTFTTHTELDPTFSYTGEHVTNNQVTLPISSNTWSYIFANLPTFARGTVEGVDHEVSFNYSYFLEEVSSNSPDGTTVVYEDLAGHVISSPTDAETTESGTLNITNKVPTGFLRIDKEVTYNGVAPTTAAQKSALAGTYRFKVYTDANCSKPYKVIQGEAPNQQEVDLELTVTIGEDGTAQSSETVKIPVGDYWIEEQTPSQTGVTPEENRIKVTITADQTTDTPAIASFTNNKEESDNPDEMAIELEKTFTGLPKASMIPAGYQAVLTYTYNGSPVIVALTGSTQGNVTCTKSPDGMTWHWRITQIPKTATNFGVYESNYDISGYTRITKINGSVVENPGAPQAVAVQVPEITMTNITDQYTTTDNNKVFTVADNQILLVRMTNHATVVVSQKSLSMATRQAIEKTLEDNGGKIPGDEGANAQWVMNFVYFSHEIQGDSFSYGGRTIFFNGDQVIIPHKSSSHEVRVDIAYTSTSAENSFTLENNYTEVPTELDVLKVEKGSETTTQLPGAVFELRKLEDVAPTDGGTLTYVKDDNQQVIVESKTTGDNGRLTFSNLTYGVYEIRELTPPPGYVQTEDVTFYIRVEGGVITYVEKGSNKPSEWTEASNTDPTVHFTPAIAAVEDDTGTPEDETVAAANATFRVGNTPGAALPHTGGSGTSLYSVLGGALILGAGLLLWSRRRLV